ncbi:MAG: Fic family protein [Pseudomonadales bacterium]|nr:Fic family protein [Pseudomonadales bacterium]
MQSKSETVRDNTMEYRAIEDIPEGTALEELASSELAALGELWKEKKGELENSGEYRNFIKRMQREWAIETGIIERLYTWDRGVTETLIEQGIDSSLISHVGGINRDEADNIAKMIEDQQNIVDGLFGFVKGENPFSEHFIRSMHEQLTAHQDFTEAMTQDGKIVKVALVKGQYKMQPNNPKRPDGGIHEYCPPELVTDEMERLVKLYSSYEQQEIAPEILSAWIHHRFTQIHPFQDGNGRIARAIASLVFLKSGLFPLVVRDSDREVYIEYLEEADKGDLTQLVKFFAKRQRDSILSALGIQQQVVQAKHSQQIINNAIALLNRKSKAEKDQLKAIYQVAGKLQILAEEKLGEIQNSLDPQLRNIDTVGNETYNSSIKAARDGDAESYFFRRQIVDIAKQHGYYANCDNYKSWTRLIVYTTKIFEVVFSIHGYGHGDNGVMVVSGFTFEKIPSEETSSGTESTDTKPCNQDIFQFNYLESEQSIIKRFKDWLEESVTIALAEWQRTIA